MNAPKLKLQIFDSVGNPNGGEITLANDSTGLQLPTQAFGGSIANLGSDGFIIVQKNQDFNSGGDEIWAQKFSADGQKLGGGQRVGITYTSGGETGAIVAALDNGRYVVAWYSTQLNSLSVSRIKAQVFNEDGSTFGGQFQSTSANDFEPIDITPMTAGKFVVSWCDKLGDLHLQLVQANGTKVGNEIAIKLPLSYPHVFDSAIESLNDGRFVVAWGTLVGVSIQVFNENGTKSGSEFSIENVDWTDLEISVLSQGKFVVTWQSTGQTLADTSDTSIHAQIFDAGTNPPTLNDLIPNDAASTVNFDLGKSISSSIHQKDLDGSIVDKDYYKVTLTAGKTYVFTANANGSTSDTLDSVFIRLRDANGNPLPVDKFDEGGTASFSYTAETSGTFFLAISAGGDNYADKTGVYSIGFAEKSTIPVVTSDVDTVANDIRTDAGLSGGVSKVGRINQVDGATTDVDYYKVTLTEGHKYTFSGDASVNSTDSLSSLFIRLRDANGNAVTGEFAEGATPSIEFTAEKSGIYYLAVGAGGDGAADKTGSYTVTTTDLGTAAPVATPLVAPDKAMLEYFARDIAYRFGFAANGGLDPNPNVKNPANDSIFVTTGYRVDRTFVTENGFVAVALVSDTKQPVIAIRGSLSIFDYRNSLLDWFDNTNPQGVGVAEFNTAWADSSELGLKAWLKAHAAEGINIVGHSQGGAQAQLVAAYATGKYETGQYEIEQLGIRVSSLTTYNSPGISDAARLIANIANVVQVEHRISSGDIVSLVGQSYISGKVQVYDLDTINANPISLGTHFGNAHTAHWSEASYYLGPYQNDILTLPRVADPINLGNISSSTLGGDLYSPLYSNNGIDSEYFAFVLAVAQFSPSVAVSLLTRAGAENLRSTIGVTIRALEAIGVAQTEFGAIIDAALTTALLKTANGIVTIGTWTVDTVRGIAAWGADKWLAVKDMAVEKWQEIAQMTASQWEAIKDWTAQQIQELSNQALNTVDNLLDMTATALNKVQALGSITEAALEKLFVPLVAYAPSSTQKLAASAASNIYASETVAGTSKSEFGNFGLGNDKVNPGGGFDQIILGAGADVVVGRASQLDGSTIHDFTMQDKIIINGVSLGKTAFLFSKGTSIDIDLNGDGKYDATIALKGKFDLSKFVVSRDGTNTIITTRDANVGINQSGNSSDNKIEGSGGKDKISGLAGKDQLIGGSGNDTLDGGTGSDVLNGGAGTDTAYYVGGAAATLALDGSFKSAGASVGDILMSIENISGSNKGNDKLAGNNSANRLDGNGGNDTLFGRGGNDSVYGGKGVDKIYGEGGNDTLVGGLGADILSGGVGVDKFRYNSASEGNDRISSFSSADYFVFDSKAFGGMAKGTLAKSMFVSRADNYAQDGNDYFVYRTTDDTLWFDADGSGTGGAVKIADLSNDFKLTASDILIV